MWPRQQLAVVLVFARLLVQEGMPGLSRRTARARMWSLVRGWRRKTGECGCMSQRSGLYVLSTYDSCVGSVLHLRCTNEDQANGDGKLFTMLSTIPLHIPLPPPVQNSTFPSKMFSLNVEVDGICSATKVVLVGVGVMVGVKMRGRQL